MNPSRLYRVCSSRLVIPIPNSSSRIIDGFISTKGLNEPLLKYVRLRQAAISILKSHLGQDKVITIIDDVKPPEWGHIFIRFKVTETQ